MITVMKTMAIRGDAAGQVIDGRFTLLKWLGGDDASVVFLSEMQGDRTQQVAIRLIPADGVDADAQISQWRAAAALSHPHVMRILQTGSCHIGGDRYFYAVTEYAEEVLSEVLPERALTAAETGEMLGPILDALAYLHGKGLVHGRLKPSNLLVVNDHLKLSSEDIQSAGKVSKQMGRPDAHEAPECAEGHVSPASDLWSLGVTLVEALTQRPPVFDRASGADPIVPESVPEPFTAIVRECLRVDPGQRCTLGDVWARLDGKAGPAKPEDAADAVIPARFRLPVIIGAVVVVIAVIAIALSRSHRPEVSPSEPAPAATEAQKPAPVTPEPVAAAPQEPPPAATKPHASKGSAVKGEVAEQAMPDVTPKAIASIRGQVHVSVRVTVDRAGNVSNAELDSPGPSKYFAKAALDAAPRWKFDPVVVNGEAVSSVWLLQFKFKQSGTEVNPIKVSP
jgi:TonB family protein